MYNSGKEYREVVTSLVWKIDKISDESQNSECDANRKRLNSSEFAEILI